MRLSSRISPEYAHALKDAIVMRRSGKIDMATDDALGHICNSIAEWATAEMVLKGKLWRTFSQDEDFRAHVRLHVVKALDKVALDKAPREMLVYLKTSGVNSINHYIRDANRLKRKHEDVDIFDSDAKSDFYGRHIKELNINHQSEEEKQDEQLRGRNHQGTAGGACRNADANRTADAAGTGTRAGTFQQRRIAEAKRRAAAARTAARTEDPGLATARRRAAAAYARHPQDGERLFLL